MKKILKCSAHIFVDFNFMRKQFYWIGTPIRSFVFFELTFHKPLEIFHDQCYIYFFLLREKFTSDVTVKTIIGITFCQPVCLFKVWDIGENIDKIFNRLNLLSSSSSF